MLKNGSMAKRGVDFCSGWALSWGRRANTMLITKALSQDVMVLAFVPLLLIPKESLSLHSNQLLRLKCIFWYVSLIYSDKTEFQQQMFYVRKRSVSNKCFMCESAASATDVLCAKAQRQQQMFYVRKRSVSNKCFMCESVASATTT
ncbi:hypothetical protein ACQKOF_14295 [Lysinibacillus sp. NPDC093190]|uniref:hypothetical protein n=1 Tax=Lysinibacillus sp. NPDC093190 TaxID=3390575 RepID=UPI003D067B98